MSELLCYKDDHGDPVLAGDKVNFNYGIPPVGVVAEVICENNELMIVYPAPHTPKKTKLKLLRRYVGQFWRVTRPSE